MAAGWRVYLLDRRRVAPLILAAVVALQFGTRDTWAAWSADTSTPSNSFQSAPDWVAPTVTASTVALTNGKSVGTIGPSSTYYVYANATDAGNPPGGVATVSANVDVLSAGESNHALAAGTYTIGGVTYGWRSGALTADAGLAHGSYTYGHASADVAGNTRAESGFPAAVDAVGPTAADIQATNKAGGAAGVPEEGDTIVYTFSEPVDPESIIAGWSGAAVDVLVQAAGKALPGGVHTSDWTVHTADGATQLPLGTVVAGAHVKKNNTASFGGMPASTMVLSGSTLTLTLGSSLSPANVLASPGAVTMSWTPSSVVTDMVANPATTAAATETGANDADF